MKKNNKLKVLKITLALVMSAFLVVGVGTSVFAEGTSETPEIASPGGEYGSDLPQDTTESGESMENIFEDIYAVVQDNADKIFSVLAFIGTIVVSIGYKSGLLPLLNDALSKLKTAMDGVRENGEKMNADTTEKIAEMDVSIKELEKNVGEIGSYLRECKAISLERREMRSVLEGQIDMLYAIFMSSALPQYQKDEIGTRIQNMREELASYEKSVE